VPPAGHANTAQLLFCWKIFLPNCIKVHHGITYKWDEIKCLKRLSMSWLCYCDLWVFILEFIFHSVSDLHRFATFVFLQSDSLCSTKFGLAASCVMSVPLAGPGDTVGVWARWSLRLIKEFCGSGGCNRNLGGTKLLLWKVERQHGLGERGAGVHMCCHVHFFWYLHIKGGGMAEGCRCHCSFLGECPSAARAGDRLLWLFP